MKLLRWTRVIPTLFCLLLFLKKVNIKYILEILSCMEFAVVTFTEKDIGSNFSFI